MESAEHMVFGLLLGQAAGSNFISSTSSLQFFSSAKKYIYNIYIYYILYINIYIYIYINISKNLCCCPPIIFVSWGRNFRNREPKTKNPAHRQEVRQK